MHTIRPNQTHALPVEPKDRTNDLLPWFRTEANSVPRPEIPHLMMSLHISEKSQALNNLAIEFGKLLFIELREVNWKAWHSFSRSIANFHRLLQQSRTQHTLPQAVFFLKKSAICSLVTLL
jgi:hypothetical protein